jgi:hypothetical protein
MAAGSDAGGGAGADPAAARRASDALALLVTLSGRAS